MHKATVALAAFVVFLGCNADSPTSPGAAKYSEAETEQCPMPILGIAGTWSGQSRFEVSREYISTADTLRIELAPDPNPTGEPGVTYYDYTLLSYYSPSERDDPALADLGLPSLYSERRGKMGVYYADGGKWAFNHTGTYFRIWDEETKEYKEGSWLFGDFYQEDLETLSTWLEWDLLEAETNTWPVWGLEIKMFDGWLALGWEEDSDDNYERVDE